VAAAPVAKSNDALAEKFHMVTSAMFSFFSVGMLVGMDKMFGPNTPLGPMMQYWTVDRGSDVVHDWLSRMFGISMLCLMQSHRYFGVPMDAWLKTSMAFNAAGLANMAHIVFTQPDECTAMWYPQVALQVIFVLINYKLIQ